MNKKIFIFIFSLFFSINYAFGEIINDEFVDQTLKDKVFDKVKTNTNYNYENTERVVIKLTPKEIVSTKKYIQKGDILTFTVKQNVKVNNKVIILKGTTATARIKSYTTRGWAGIPGQILVDDFEIKGIDSNKLKSTYIKRGFDATAWIFPIKAVLTPIPFVGSITNLMIGGHGKISFKDTVVLYYYPNWTEKI